MNRLTVRQASERLGVAASTVYLLCARGLIRHVRIGAGRGTIRIPEEALAAYERSRTVDGPRPDPGVALKHIRLEAD